jgi:eukaryotic-like serine/threonine-protein kinase
MAGRIADAREIGGSGGLSALLDELARSPDLAPAKWETCLHAGRVVGRFELLREIGRGSFGVVFEALDSELGRKVAFKVFRPRAGARAAGTQELLRREAEAVAHLNHPNICTLHDVGHCEAGTYLILERLEGETLERLLRRGALPADRALEIAVQVGRALAHAHAAGVVHRDLKPANVFLTERGEVKVLDFGLSQFLGETSPGRAGSPAYMAPEQWRGEPTDARTDVFSLGVMTFEMMSGRRPFAVEMDRSSVLDPGPPPALPPGLAPAPVAALLARMLAKDPDERPVNGQVLLEALLGPPPCGRAGRLVAELRRRRVPGATLAYLAVAFVLLLLAEVVGWVLDLPRWFLQVAVGLALIGLPVNVVLAWYLDVVPDGGARPLPRKPTRAVVASLMALALANAAWRFWPGSEPHLGQPIRVAVADLANGTRDHDLDGLSGMLSASLERSPRLTVVNRDRVAELLAGAGLARDGQVDEPAGREAARRAGAQALVTGTLRQFDEVYSIEMTVIDPESGDSLFSLEERVRGKASIPAMIDRLAKGVRAQLH